MAGLRFEGDTSGNVAEVDGDKQLFVKTSSTPSKAGFSRLVTELDAGAALLTPTLLAPEVSRDYRLRVGQDAPWFNEQFPGTLLNTSLWTAPATTMTVAQASNFVTLNSGNSVAANAVAQLSSKRSFPCHPTYPLYLSIRVQVTTNPQNNNTCEWGLGIAASTTAPTDGAYFRIYPNAEFRAVVCFNGVEVTSLLDFARLGTDSARTCLLAIIDTRVDFWIEDVLVATIPLPVGQPAVTASAQLPIFARNYNGAVAPATAQQLKIGQTQVSLGDLGSPKPWREIIAGAGGGAYQTQTGSTPGQTAQYANSAAPAAATPTNTTAALGAFLQGFFTANTAGLLVDTDYIISSHQVPAGTAAVPGKSMYVYGVTIEAVNTVIAVGATPMTWVMSLAFGHTAVSLATAESATSKAPRRMPIGVQSLAATAAVGTVAASRLEVKFSSPIVVHPGEFFQTVMRLWSFTSVATQAIRFAVAVNAQYE